MTDAGLILMKNAARNLAVLSFALSLAMGCSDSRPRAVQVAEVSTLDYYGSLGASVTCANTADRPYFFTLRLEFMDDNGVVKEIQEPFLIIGGGETETYGITAENPSATKVRCVVKNCSPQ